ncbi:VOC family protein [Halomonas korlensis]|uniref:VOC domain-containing protein n=1 Tax=Halomonas korlensis TaxID=463301 RepID=A0A1I7HAA7_9GAMM|nr:VOC family protein [Halomonas korlensis]SFU57617.1 hypothetical protein SAMN04487955_10493 [Halomonas korlensis]
MAQWLEDAAMEQRMSLVTLGVGDLARARRFYEAGLGWQVGLAVDDEVVFFQLNGLILSLYPRDALARDAGVEDMGSGFAGFALAHNVGSEPEVDAVLSEAQRAGGRIVKPASRAEWGGYSGYFTDPDGHLWEVAHNPGFPIDAEGNTSLG